MLLAAITLVASSACQKNAPEFGDYPIAMYVKEAQTRALLDPTKFAAEGNQLHIYDYYTPSAGDPTYHIDDQVESQGSAIWPFVGQRYSWTPDGVHKFYGWMYKDVNENPALTAESFFGTALKLDDADDHILELPARTVHQQDTPQFDFMYSDIYERNLNENPDYMSPVELKFSHLFSSFGIAARNVSTNITYRLHSVQVEGLVTRASAVIDFRNNEKVGVSYNNPGNANGNTPDYSFTFDDRLVLSSTLTDIATTASAEDDRQYFIAWPMTAEQAGQVKITVVYDTGNDSNQSTKTLTLSEDAWEAGKKNNINIVFIDKEVHLICTVKDWEYHDEEMQFTDVVTVHEDGKLKWEATSINSLNDQTGEVLIKSSGSPAIGHFHIETPVGATWYASLIPIGEGNVDAFEFVGPNYGKVGDDHATIQIKVKNTEDLANTQKAILRITVTTADGRTMVVNELAPSGATYKEFTIVQNMI